MKMVLQVSGLGLGISLALGMLGGYLGIDSLFLTVLSKTNPAP